MTKRRGGSDAEICASSGLFQPAKAKMHPLTLARTRDRIRQSKYNQKMFDHTRECDPSFTRADNGYSSLAIGIWR